MIMKTKFVWFLTYLFVILATDKNIIYKYHLRGLIEKERNREIQKIISTEYKQIYNKILQEKTIGVSKIQFIWIFFKISKVTILFKNNKENLCSFIFLISEKI